MKNLKKKGFTIVELVIVIAVIAVLATVLIPSFSNIINNSQISADKSTVSNLNKQISVELVDKEIESASDLERIIKKIFGEKYYDNLKPNSASQGYNFWFNTKTKKVELKKYDESFESKMMNLSVTTKTFDETNFRQFGDYYLLDQGGSDFADAIKGLETLKTLEDYIKVIELINKIISNVNNHHYSQTTILAEKVANTAIIGDNGTFRYSDYATVTNVLFVSGIETINSNLYLYNGTEVTSTSSSEENPIANVLEITLPNTVKSVEGSSLYFKVEKTVKIYGSFATIEEVKSIFKAYSTNGIIMCEETGGLILNGSVLEDLNGNSQGNLGYSNPVASFDISCEETDKIKYVSGTLYVAYDQKEFQLNVENFVGENPNSNISSEKVSWSSDNSDVLSVDENGKVTIERIPSVGEVAEYTLTATAIAGGHQETIVVIIERPRDVTFTLAGLALDMAKDEEASEEEQIEKIEIEYTGKSGESFDFTDINIECLTNMVDCDITFSVTAGTGEILKITKKDGIYTLNLLKPTDSVGLTQQFTINIGTAMTKTFEVSVKNTSAEPFKVNEPFASAKFLYRVGNQNEVSLKHFFANKRPEANFFLSMIDGETLGPIGSGNLSAIVKVDGEAINHTNGNFALTSDNWEKVTIDFNGCGVVELKIGEVTLMLEVVIGVNVINYGDLKTNANNVLLNNITMSDNYKFNFTNVTLYGNDFIFDVTKGNYEADADGDGKGYVSENYRITLNNSVLDNVRIIGNPFNDFSASAKDSNNICNVLSIGDSKIINSYISYCAAPVRYNGGNLEIVNTTLIGGSIANLDIRNGNGNVILENVTTINQRSVNGIPASEGSVGFGIITWYENVDNLMITVKGQLTQYNYMSEDDFRKIPLNISNIDLSNILAEAVFKNSDTSGFIYTDNKGTKWINTGIFSMIDTVGSDNIKIQNMDNASEYSGSVVSYSLMGNTKSGYLFTKKSANVTLVNPEKEYETAGQGMIYPSFIIDNSKNNVNIVDNSKVYCYEDGGIIYISFNDGESKEFTLADLCKALKNGIDLPLLNIYLDGSLYTDDTITFDQSGTHKLRFEFDDKYNYDINGSSIVKQHSYELKINVTEAEPDAKNAEFTFANTDTNTSTEKLTINNKIYISATGVAEKDKEWGYITVEGTRIYYPITEAQMKKNTFGTEVQVYYYVFKDSVTITDYKDGVTGSEIVYDSSTKNMPSNLTVVNGMEAKYTEIASACVDISKLTKDGPSGEVWDFSASTTVSGTTTYNGYLAHQSPSGLAIKSGTRDYDAITVAQFSYTDEAGATYYYFIGYYMPNQVSGDSGDSGCVTPDTLITLADGTKKRVDELTGEEKLLVWNLETGSYDFANIIFVDSEEEREYRVIHLYFSDGSEVKVISEHGFFDVDLAKYVYIDENNYSDYIGHRFIKSGNVTNNSWMEVKLERVTIDIEVTSAWSPVTSEQLCYYTNDILSMPGGIEGLFNIFEVDTNTMSYDVIKMAQDIEKYGLYTYEDFTNMIPEEAFIVFNGDWLKVAIGKGILTWEDIEKYAERYIPLM